MKNEILTNWEKYTNELAEFFAVKYFGRDVSDMYWVADRIGEVYAISDYFFNLNDMVDYLKYNYTIQKMFEHHDYELICLEKSEIPINIKNYRQLK